MSYISLENRSVMALYGPDTKNFLQNIITNDINKLDNQKAIYSLMLSNHGKYLYDFFLIKHGKYIILECEDVYLQQIIEKINLLKTYLKVEVKDISSIYKVAVSFDYKPMEYKTECNESQIIFNDPRHKSLGKRILHKYKAGADQEIDQKYRDFTQYEKIRIENIIPDGTKDMVQNSSFPLQYLIDKINGISFNKGCYIGQEVTNRMSRQETLRKKLYLVKGDNKLPSIGTKIKNENDEEMGEMRSSLNNIGLALLYTKKSHTNLYTNGIKISVH